MACEELGYARKFARDTDELQNQLDPVPRSNANAIALVAAAVENVYERSDVPKVYDSVIIAIRFLLRLSRSQAPQ